MAIDKPWADAPDRFLEVRDRPTVLFMGFDESKKNTAFHKPYPLNSVRDSFVYFLTCTPRSLDASPLGKHSDLKEDHF